MDVKNADACRSDGEWCCIRHPCRFRQDLLHDDIVAIKEDCDDDDDDNAATVADEVHDLNSIVPLSDSELSFAVSIFVVVKFVRFGVGFADGRRNMLLHRP